MTQLAFTWPGEERRLDVCGADRELVHAMEARHLACPIRWSVRPVNDWHAAHTYEQDGETVQCPGLVTRMCGREGLHDHHRWAEVDAFFWCQPFDYLVAAGAPVRQALVPSVSVDFLSRRP